MKAPRSIQAQKENKWRVEVEERSREKLRSLQTTDSFQCHSKGCFQAPISVCIKALLTDIFNLYLKPHYVKVTHI